MKFLAVVLVLLSLTSFGQKLKLGPEAGSNLIMLYKSDLGRDYHLGWFAGTSVEYDMTDFFSLRSGVYLSQRKKRYESFDTLPMNIFGFDPEDLEIPGVDFSMYQETVGVQTQLGIEVPMLASFNHKGFSIFAGPYIHFMAGAWSKERTDTRVPFLQTFNIDSIDPSGFLKYLFPPAHSTDFTESSSKENLRVFDYGFKAGMSYGDGPLRSNFYYTIGLPGYLVDPGLNDPNPHHYYTLSVTYNFGAGKTGASSFGD